MEHTTAKPAPALNIPASNNTVTVSVIDATAIVKGRAEKFVTPLVGALEWFKAVAYVFLIENPRNGQKILFDLGVRKDFFNTAPPVMAERVKNKLGFDVEVQKDVAEIIVENGVDLKDISSIVWSHVHWDHTGNVAAFLPSTELVVGPGFQDAFMPGYPADSEGKFFEEDYKGRNVREIAFDQGLVFADIGAYDFFGDGSFYLLDTPGHCQGHLCGLARTTPSTFVLMGADVCHFGGQLRPSAYRPLPEEIDPSSMPEEGMSASGQAYLAIHPQKDRTKPFFRIAVGPDGNSIASDPAEASKTIEKVVQFDANEDVLFLFAHDTTVSHLLDYHPKSINDWKARGWKERFHWNFLSDFGVKSS